MEISKKTSFNSRSYFKNDQKWRLKKTTLKDYLKVYFFFNIKKGMSAFLSQPHFLNADPMFVNAVDGLAPNLTEHDFVLYFEPVHFFQSFFGLIGFLFYFDI